jgi:hypothetical protein
LRSVSKESRPRSAASNVQAAKPKRRRGATE